MREALILEGLAARATPSRCATSVSSVLRSRGVSRVAGAIAPGQEKPKLSFRAPVDSGRAEETLFTLISPPTVPWTCVLNLSR